MPVCTGPLLWGCLLKHQTKTEAGMSVATEQECPTTALLAWCLTCFSQVSFQKKFSFCIVSVHCKKITGMLAFNLISSIRGFRGTKLHIILWKCACLWISCRAYLKYSKENAAWWNTLVQLLDTRLVKRSLWILASVTDGFQYAY